MRRALAMTGCVGALALATNAHAFVGCQGSINSIELRQESLLIVDYGWGPIRICYLSSDSAMPTATVKKETCSALYSSFTTAKAAHTTVTSWHPNSTTCSTALAQASNDHLPAEQPYGYAF